MSHRKHLLKFMRYPGTKSVFSVIMTALFLASFVKPLTVFKSYEKAPHPYPRVPKKGTQFGEGTREVITGLHVIDFPEFGMVTNEFTLDGIIWFEFDPKVVSSKSIESFSIDRGTLLQKRLVDSKIIGSSLLMRYYIRARFTSNLEHHHFPLGDHTIYFSLVNYGFTSDELFFTNARVGFRVADSIDTKGWSLVSRDVESGHSMIYMSSNDPSMVLSYPRVVYAFHFKKPGLRDFLVLIIPFFIYLLGMFALVMRPGADSIIGLTLSSASFSVLLGYRFVVEWLTPKVGYFTVSDKINLVLFLASCVVLLRSVHLHTLRVLSVDEESSSRLGTQVETINTILFYLIQTAVVLATLWFIWA